MKTFYRVINNGFSLFETCLISEDHLADFIYQHRNIVEMIIVENSGKDLINVQSGKVVHCSELEVKELNEAIQSLEESDSIGTWEALNLYKFDIEVFQTESFYLFSREQEQAEKEFAEWSIFDAIDVQLVA